VLPTPPFKPDKDPAETAELYKDEKCQTLVDKGGPVGFLTTDLIVVGLWRWKLAVLDREKHEKWSENGPKFHALSIASPAKALILTSGKITSKEWVDDIYLLRLGNPLQRLLTFRRPLKSGTDFGWRDADDAISPNGSRVAVIRGSWLQMYSLEP